MSNLIRNENSIFFNNVLDNDFSLSILDYKKFDFPNKNKIYLGDICKIEQGTFIDNIDRTVFDTSLAYITIRDFDGYSLPKKIKNYIIPRISFKNLEIEEQIILVSDAGSIGKSTFVFNGIKGINADGITRLKYLNQKNFSVYFLYGCIQHYYFPELLKTIAPSGATQQNVEIKHFKQAFIPFPNQNSENTIKFVEFLTQAIINKEQLIKSRHESILKLIEQELLNNQKPNKFKFDLPTFNEINETSRLDTGVYTEQFKEIKHLVSNYKNGFFNIDTNKIKSGSTPDVRFIGNLKDLKNRWVTPSHCSDYGTFVEERINLLGNNNINEDCILLINRTSKGGIGEYVGIAGFYNFKDFGKGHHNQGMYRVFNYETHKLLFILSFLNCTLMRKYCSGLSIGSKMKELKIEQFLQIPFPNFDVQKQYEIALLYYNSESIYNSNTFTLDNFIEEDNAFNETAGIYELDKTAKQLKEILNKAIDNIINDKEVTINFTV